MVNDEGEGVGEWMGRKGEGVSGKGEVRGDTNSHVVQCRTA